MANFIVLEDDARVERQIKMYIKELDEEAQIRFFSSNEDFDKKYCFTKKDIEGDPNQDPATAVPTTTPLGKADEDELFQLLSSVDVVIFKAQSIKEEIRGWVSKTIKQLKANKFCTDEKPTRFIVTKYEEDGIEKDYFIHPLIEDIIFLPLDRLIFLQKLEIIQNLPRKIKPSFLFSMPVEQQLEISKKALIERISDMGFAIRNPFRLAAGTINHIYLKLPGQKETYSLYGRVIYSEPHPEAPNQFLVHHTYLGADTKYTQAVKKYLVTQSGYKELANENAASFKIKMPTDPKQIARMPEKVVAVLDVDNATAESVVGLINAEIDRVKLVKENSLYFFFKKYIEKEQQLGAPGTKDDLFAPVISFTVKLSNQNLIEVQSKPAKSDLFVGHTAVMLFARPTGWQLPFNHPDAKALLDEAFTLAKAGQRFSQPIALMDANSTLKVFQLTTTIGRDKDSVKLEIAPPESKKKEENKKIAALDAIIINQSMVPDNIEDWKARIKEVCTQNGVVTPEHDIPIILIADEKSGYPPKKYRYSKVFGMVYKPLKSRNLCYQVSTACNWPYTKFNHMNIPSVKAVIPAHVAIESKLQTIAEFGAAFSHNKAFTPGAFVYLHESIYVNAPDGNLCARVYFAEADPKDKTRFLCHLIYFGITDQFLKFTRNWIRKDFAEKKQSQG